MLDICTPAAALAGLCKAALTSARDQYPITAAFMPKCTRRPALSAVTPRRSAALQSQHGPLLIDVLRLML